MKQNSLNGWFKSGAPGVWISGGAVSIAVIMTIGLLAVIAVRGLGHFWPADLIHASYDVPGQASHMAASIKWLLQNKGVTGTAKGSIYTTIIPITKANAAVEGTCWKLAKN